MPLNGRRTYAGMSKRLMYDNVLSTVARVGQLRSTGLIEPRFIEAKFRGTLEKLKKVNPFTLTIPPKVEQSRLASAMKSMMGRD